MKVAILVSIARQVEGEYVFIKVMRANSEPEVLHKYLRENTLPRTENMSGVNCVIEYGVFEDVEIEGT